MNENKSFLFVVTKGAYKNLLERVRLFAVEHFDLIIPPINSLRNVYWTGVKIACFKHVLTNLEPANVSHLVVAKIALISPTLSN